MIYMFITFLSGGGAGGDLPYRAYIDAGTTLLCVVTLSFAAPLVAPFAVMFFLVSEPVWRQTLLYVVSRTCCDILVFQN